MYKLWNGAKRNETQRSAMRWQKNETKTKTKKAEITFTTNKG